MTPEDLNRAETAYQTASAAAETARVVRNELVRRAIGEGWTHAQVARATGLTRGRIGQMATKETKR